MAKDAAARRGRQPTIVTTMTDLAAAHVSVAPVDNGHVRLTVSAAFAAVEMTDRPEVVGQLLTDAVAQLDAIEVVSPNGGMGPK